MDRNGYNPSIMQTQKECYISKMQNCDLVRHEIFFGSANRELSKKYGAWVYLTPHWHTMVHSVREIDLKLKKEAELKFRQIYHELDFIKIFGKSFL